VVRWAKATGYDTIWIDMEHSTLPVDTVAQLCSCAVDLGLTPWVRVPERDYRTINRVLDAAPHDSSQECPGCGHTHPENRKEDRFFCIVCGSQRTRISTRRARFGATASRDCATG